MSYEGYSQYLCTRGHQTQINCYVDDLEICPICGAKIVWWNAVDVTNGSYYDDPETGEEIRIDGYIELEIDKDGKAIVAERQKKLQALLDIVWRVRNHLEVSNDSIDNNLGLELKETLEKYIAIKDTSTYTTYKIPKDKGYKIGESDGQE